MCCVSLAQNTFCVFCLSVEQSLTRKVCSFKVVSAPSLWAVPLKEFVGFYKRQVQKEPDCAKQHTLLEILVLLLRSVALSDMIVVQVVQIGRYFSDLISIRHPYQGF